MVTLIITMHVIVFPFHHTAEMRISLSLRILQIQLPLYSLVCRTSNSPATIVTWRRDSERVDSAMTTAVTRRDYVNVLNVAEEGVYSCEVFTSSTLRNTRETRTVNVTSMFEESYYRNIITRPPTTLEFTV